jgi:outer membrane immunogenic protein
MRDAPDWSLPLPMLTFADSAQRNAAMDHLFRNPRRAAGDATRKMFFAAVLAAAPSCALAAGTPPVPFYDWSGFYVGANVGHGVARNPATERQLNLPNSVFNDEKITLSPTGGLGGLQGGFNWQAHNWVLGLEADFQWSGQADKSFCIDGCSFYEGTRVSQRLPWFATTRGRVGYAAGAALFYATGGFAVARVETTVSPYDAPPVKYFPFGVNARKSGWTAGGGIEAAISGPWTAKVEYLYLDLGEIAASGRTGGPASAGQVSSTIRDHIFRAGINYRFGVPADTHAASASNQKETPPFHYEWRGFYIGGNAGYGVARNTSSARFIDFAGDPLETFVQSPAGGLIGAQVGYNWQYGHWLVGLEGDLQYANQASASCVNSCIDAHSLNVDQSIRWLGTVRGRVGYVPGTSLFYMTAGLAYGGVSTSGLFGQSANLPQAPYGASSTEVGWALGGAIETPISANWSIKAEYLFIDLGNTGHTKAVTDGGEGFPAVIEIDSRIHDHIFRAGLNYKFGAPSSQ